MKIILFEDTEQKEIVLVEAIRKALRRKGKAVVFKPRHVAPRGGMYDERLKLELIKAGYPDASLLVVDRDLSKLPGYTGLSEPTVRLVAERLGIPECGYARGQKESADFLSDFEMRESRIALSLQGGNDAFATKVVAIAAGFDSIIEQLPNAQKRPGRKSPGKLLASILGKEGYAEKIALYASGDQNRLASLPLKERGRAALHRLGCVLGYWLWDSILRFPGVVVNQVAAASYLNIEARAFDRIQRVFEEARYRGPFALARSPLWWRGALDDIVAKSGAESGREFAEGKTRKRIPPSQCCEDKTRSAGYYCMLSGRPVSLENSKEGLAWFPRGADLARISKSKYDEIGPWL